MAFNIEQYIYEQRRIGKDDKQIATSLGMSLKHFQNFVSGKKENVTEKRAKKAEEKKKQHEKQKEQFRGWRDEGLSNAEIAEKANVAEATVIFDADGWSNVVKDPTQTTETVTE